jgi:hypothetical protein
MPNQETRRRKKRAALLKKPTQAEPTAEDLKEKNDEAHQDIQTSDLTDQVIEILASTKALERFSKNFKLPKWLFMLITEAKKFKERGDTEEASNSALEEILNQTFKEAGAKIEKKSAKKIIEFVAQITRHADLYGTTKIQNLIKALITNNPSKIKIYFVEQFRPLEREIINTLISKRGKKDNTEAAEYFFTLLSQIIDLQKFNQVKAPIYNAEKENEEKNVEMIDIIDKSIKQSEQQINCFDYFLKNLLKKPELDWEKFAQLVATEDSDKPHIHDNSIKRLETYIIQAKTESRLTKNDLSVELFLRKNAKKFENINEIFIKKNEEISNEVENLFKKSTSLLKEINDFLGYMDENLSENRILFNAKKNLLEARYHLDRLKNMVPDFEYKFIFHKKVLKKNIKLKINLLQKKWNEKIIATEKKLDDISKKLNPDFPEVLPELIKSIFDIPANNIKKQKKILSRETTFTQVGNQLNADKNVVSLSYKDYVRVSKKVKKAVYFSSQLIDETTEIVSENIYAFAQTLSTVSNLLEEYELSASKNPDNLLAQEIFYNLMGIKLDLILFILKSNKETAISNNQPEKNLSAEKETYRTIFEKRVSVLEQINEMHKRANIASAELFNDEWRVEQERLRKKRTSNTVDAEELTKEQDLPETEYTLQKTQLDGAPSAEDMPQASLLNARFKEINGLVKNKEYSKARSTCQQLLDEASDNKTKLSAHISHLEISLAELQNESKKSAAKLSNQILESTRDVIKLNYQEARSLLNDCNHDPDKKNAEGLEDEILQEMSLGLDMAYNHTSQLSTHLRKRIAFIKNMVREELALENMAYQAIKKKMGAAWYADRPKDSEEALNRKKLKEELIRLNTLEKTLSTFPEAFEKLSILKAPLSPSKNSPAFFKTIHDPQPPSVHTLSATAAEFFPEHKQAPPITQGLLDMLAPPEIQELMRDFVLRSKKPIALFGGAIRDVVLQKTVNDYDVCTTSPRKANCDLLAESPIIYTLFENTFMERLCTAILKNPKFEGRKIDINTCPEELVNENNFFATLDDYSMTGTDIEIHAIYLTCTLDKNGDCVFHLYNTPNKQFLTTYQELEDQVFIGNGSIKTTNPDLNAIKEDPIRIPRILKTTFHLYPKLGLDEPLKAWIKAEGKKLLGTLKKQSPNKAEHVLCYLKRTFISSLNAMDDQQKRDEAMKLLRELDLEGLSTIEGIDEIFGPDPMTDDAAEEQSPRAMVAMC